MLDTCYNEHFFSSFMYKAFNTFIDDVFAFIITMPTAHRVACFRGRFRRFQSVLLFQFTFLLLDDIIFLVYLYQRWLYPVDKKRIDAGSTMDEAEEYEAISEETEEKKTQ